MSTEDMALRQQVIDKINKYSKKSNVEPDSIKELLKTNFETQIAKEILLGYQMTRSTPYGITPMQFSQYLDLLHQEGVIVSEKESYSFRWDRHAEVLGKVSKDYNNVLNLLVYSQQEKDNNKSNISPDTDLVALMLTGHIQKI